MRWKTISLVLVSIPFLSLQGQDDPVWQVASKQEAMSALVAAARGEKSVRQTVDSFRLWDVLRSVELLRAEVYVDPERIAVAGSGIAGILGLYAAILDTDIQQVLLLRPPSSHIEGPVFPNILRYTDIPEAAALLAPRRLNFYSRIPEGFQDVREVYRLYGHPDYVSRTMDFYSILHGSYNHSFCSGL